MYRNRLLVVDSPKITAWWKDIQRMATSSELWFNYELACVTHSESPCAEVDGRVDVWKYKNGKLHLSFYINIWCRRGNLITKKRREKRRAWLERDLGRRIKRQLGNNIQCEGGKGSQLNIADISLDNSFFPSQFTIWKTPIHNNSSQFMLCATTRIVQVGCLIKAFESAQHESRHEWMWQMKASTT